MFGNCTCFPPMDRPQNPGNSSNAMTSITLSSNSTGPETFSPELMERLTPKEKMNYIDNLSPRAKIQFLEILKIRIGTFFNTANIGKCDRGCKNFYYFILLTILLVLCSFISSTPHKIMVLR